MQINAIEQTILSTVHQLPIAKQQEILDFSLFLKSNLDTLADDIKLTENTPFVEVNITENNHNTPASFQSAFRKFLKEVEQEPIDINTSIFDADRETESGRDFQL